MPSMKLILPQKLIELFPYVEQRITFIERLKLEYSEKSCAMQNQQWKKTIQKDIKI